MVEIRKYNCVLKKEWDEFVDKSKNATFLFKRGYMDYHSHRFEDHSLMYFNQKGRIVALLPANKVAGNDGLLTLYSHQGLTYGGFILDGKATMELVMELFEQTIGYLRGNSFKTFYYKQMPSCYHLCPAEEDEYALWRFGAEIAVCNISCTINLCQNSYPIPLRRDRKAGAKKAMQKSYTISEATSLNDFWYIMEKNLKEKYNASPAHSLEEMKLLMQRFPNEIKCFLTLNDGKPEAGALVYLTRQTVHVQYSHATHKGKDDGALDFLYTTLIRQFSDLGFRFFDMGTSNEEGGTVLNTNLIAQKEGFGGRGTTYKQWRFLF